MYLSKVQLDWKDARNPYDWHRALWRLFPGQPDAARNFLFRVEHQRLGQGALVLLQSQATPAAEEATVRVVAGPKSLPLTAFATGVSLRFRLTANVVKTIRDSDDPQRSVRVPLLKDEQQLDWLQRKLAESARLDGASITPNAPLFFKRKGQAGKLVTITFDGQLTVRDPDAFAELLCKGVGAAKSFGCGLLSVARAP
nr:type I-E CRISPR-associated protein Cas6/Cse3/CasE [uncultured Caldimonas sp.]